MPHRQQGGNDGKVLSSATMGIVGGLCGDRVDRRERVLVGFTSVEHLHCRISVGTDRHGWNGDRAQYRRAAALR